MNLKLKARSDVADLVTEYRPELSKFQITAGNRETGVGSVLATLNTAGEAVCRHFYLTAKYNLQPYHD